MTENVSEPKNITQPDPRERGDGGIYLRGKTWWIRYSFRGKPKRETSGSSDPRIALKKLDRRLKEVWADRNGLQPFIPKADNVLIDQLLDSLMDDYKLKNTRSLKSIKAHLKPVREASATCVRPVSPQHTWIATSNVV